jgi:hypothetical protein
VKRRLVESEAIRSVGYDAHRRLLEGEFNSGDVYHYFAVPQAVYDRLMAAESMGTWFNQTFKDMGFEYRQL